MRIMSPFPSDYGFSCVTPEDLDNYLPHPDEMRCLSPRAIPKRRREFFLGRLAAFQAIQKLGITPKPVLRGNRREPLWQDGIVGSISHKEDTAVAVVGRKSMACGVGVDLEKVNEPIHFRISKTVCTEAEVHWITEFPDEKDTRLKRIFSAKEAAFKAFFPIQQIYLSHHDAELSWCDETQSFIGVLLKSAGDYHPVGSSFEVGCQIVGRFVLSFLTLPPLGHLGTFG